ncbi:ABC-2 type transporter [Haloterrigena turkmenica DSM 5511]|uniref:ABC-2 type transporter n=1 Tax=Haloterrigena turkmenica (strain ATCC 51198 / DSM 5511 / JCM 9101 / NCIMB 13204 / VKM B-1734 / 4k) TaxID=543526 RepID=D2RZL6_HALTV|nr:ABC transporter permease subunit [Haloterrigena turkmenica]ADB62055.1 ABC-2 type transporter [Haloterrigena turkmenica DSM 5511]
MSTLAVAKKDFLDVRRAKIVWFVSSLYVLIAVLMFYFGQNNADDPEFYYALTGLTGNGAMILTLVALVTAYLAIAGERESGSIKYMLSIPNSRRDVVLGKFLTRSAVVVGSILVGFGIGAVLGVLWYPSIDVEMFLGALALTILFTLTYVSVAVGISAATASRSRAMGGTIGFFFVTTVLALFRMVSFALDWILNDIFSLELSRNALTFIEAVMSPLMAFFGAMDLVFPSQASRTAPDSPWYLEGEVMIVILLAWLVVPLVLGIWRFERADLG